MANGTKPIQVFKAGAVRASVFVNTISKNGQQFDIPKVNIQRRYKDKNGEFQSTNSYDINDLPKLIAAAFQAYIHLTKGKENGEE